jgi:heat shock protein HtpX
MPKIYIIEDSAPNAFATGRNKNHAVIAVTTGLLMTLNKNELEGVVAHEMSHIGNNDMLLMTVAVVLVGMVSIISDMLIRMSFFGGGRDNDREGGNAIMLIVGLLAAILAPIAATLLQLAISRKREFLADASASLLTRYPEGLASALEKISAYGRPMKVQSSAISHLYISSPSGSGKFAKPASLSQGGKISNLFLTHPPIEERVKRLRSSLE